MALFTFRVPSGILVATALVISLAACSPPDPASETGAPTSGTTPTSIPTDGSTPTTAPADSAPTPRLNIGCTDLGTPATFASLLTTPVTVGNPTTTALATQPTIPAAYPVRSLGGLVCEWSNGRPISGTAGEDTGYVGAQVSILPDATATWQQFVSTYLVVDNVQVYCTNAAPVFCSLNTLINGYWVEATLTGLTVADPTNDAAVQAAAKSYFDTVITTVTGATAPSLAWQPPAGTLPLPATCDELVTPAQVQTALGVPEPVFTTTGGGGWSQSSAAFHTAGILPCTWVLGNADIGVGSLSWLSGGSWAALDATATPSVPQGAQPVTVPGLDASDTAYIRCATNDDGCWVDLLVGGNWIQATVFPAEPGSPTLSVDRRTAAIQLAAQIVATVRP
ncbi:MAG: hypothetical protein JWQ43_3827 [Glaciihabitans sp.]|nr:hypothetical protein [Glaciihabitans sp.]